MKGCATLSIVRLFQLLMLPTFICLGWNFPCWVSPSGWISWESFNKNIWTIPGNEKRGESYILLMFIKIAASTWFKSHCTYIFGAGTWIIREVERDRDFFRKSLLLPHVMNCWQESAQTPCLSKQGQWMAGSWMILLVSLHLYDVLVWGREDYEV